MNTNFTFNGFHLPTIARPCKELGSPTEGHLADFVWRLSNSPSLPVATAKEFMRSAGYVPFKGYPLTVDGSATDRPNGNATCIPATKGTVVAWTDGGSRGNPGPSAYGVVLRNSNGDPIAELSKFLGHQTNNVAEYEGLLAALTYAAEAAYKRLQIHSDSELMVKQVQGIYRIRDRELSSLHAKAMDLICHFEWFSIHHVARSLNTDADRLVNQAINRGR